MGQDEKGRVGYEGGQKKKCGEEGGVGRGTCGRDIIESSRAGKMGVEN